MEANLSRKMWATLEAYHAVVYFAPEAFTAWEDLGFPHRGMGYFASRSAAMGKVGSAVVAATFYNFNPSLVARFIPAAWDIAEPSRVIDVRIGAGDGALRRILADQLDTPEMAWAAEFSVGAAGSGPTNGRPLAAAHAAVPLPDETHLRLWHALTVLREYRGDGHVHALVSGGLTGLESVVSYAATGELFDATFYRRSREWSEEEWAAGEDSLRSRGWVDESGVLTDVGRVGREMIEAQTDRLALAPWEAIGLDKADQLRAAVRPWSRAIVAAGGFGRSVT
ncbi:hypothetical protein BH23ACT5_BH23ACT5_23290 [soil metagenome]